MDARFSNPAIVDTVRRVAFDGSNRHTGALLPLIRQALAVGAPIEGLALSQALWARMCTGRREDGSTIAANDPAWEQLSAAAKQAEHHPQAWLEQRQYYGAIANHPGFCATFTDWLTRLHCDGVEATISTYLQGKSQ
ncbi:Mannitol dehydrogenase C-terminal domain-containing protein [Shimia haliotis]|uniref:Mannitol dehydrogenase C-terminal domain-containing protein n=1 Tax=Shimia haliotis TaxID=1280847 RepID=A0A1I4HLR2_9RHOB|nr:Mannitol dehydrogenase C-terminal domain-containing protein [Shimia haliotis]